MTGFDPKIYRNLKDGVGAPGDPAATDSTSPWTSVALLKGIWAKLNAPAVPTGGSTAANQATEIASLASIDGHVDGLETLAGAGNTSLASLDTKHPTVGQKAMAASTPVAFASDQSQLTVGNATIIAPASSTITRPTDTTAYASGDLLANSVTAGSVAALQFTTAARISGGSGSIYGARIQKSTNVGTNAAFRLHLFDTIPTFTSAGDNSAFSAVVQASGKGYLGYIDIASMTAFQDVCWGVGAPDSPRSRLPFKATVQTIYGIIQVNAAYTPGNAEVFTVALMVVQD